MISVVTSTPSVFRGPRPQPADYDVIKKQFCSVVSLEGSEEDAKECTELAPVQMFASPISAWQIYVAGISMGLLADILAEIVKAPKPVLVHCQHGQDRTGLIIAAYRVRCCGWTKDDAMKEALKYGYRNWANFGLNRTWKDFQ